MIKFSAKELRLLAAMAYCKRNREKAMYWFLNGRYYVTADRCITYRRAVEEISAAEFEEYVRRIWTEYGQVRYENDLF